MNQLFEIIPSGLGLISFLLLVAHSSLDDKRYKLRQALRYAVCTFSTAAATGYLVQATYPGYSFALIFMAAYLVVFFVKWPRKCDS